MTAATPDRSLVNPTVGNIVGTGIIRLIGAVLLEENDEWLLRCRYMQIEGMVEFTPSLLDADSMKLPPVAA